MQVILGTIWVALLSGSGRVALLFPVRAEKQCIRREYVRSDEEDIKLAGPLGVSVGGWWGLGHDRTYPLPSLSSYWSLAPRAEGI